MPGSQANSVPRAPSRILRRGDCQDRAAPRRLAWTLAAMLVGLAATPALFTGVWSWSDAWLLALACAVWGGYFVRRRSLLEPGLATDQNLLRQEVRHWQQAEDEQASAAGGPS